MKAETKTAKDNWPASKETHCCGTCRSFVRKEEILGRCRRNAPTMSGFPVVFETDWCDEHKLTFKQR